MSESDMIGWLAAWLTLVTFSMRSMFSLRVAAIAANVCFIAYGTASGLYPVLALHVLLLPCNVMRLCQLRSSGCSANSDSREPEKGVAGPERPRPEPAGCMLRPGNGRDWLIVSNAAREPDAPAFSMRHSARGDERRPVA